MLLLVSDANILIDIEDGNLTPAVFQLPYDIAVPDILFELELKRQHSYLLTAGLKVKSLTAKSIKKIEILRLKYSRPSVIDHSALALAMQEKCPLLTGDKSLRVAAKSEGIEVHGTVWIIEQLLNLKIIKQIQAKKSFASMKVKGSRLPWEDVEKLLYKWGVIEVKK
ncbi:MAG: PIN domain-containing protein [Chlamydiota bacterium]